MSEIEKQTLSSEAEYTAYDAEDPARSVYIERGSGAIEKAIVTGEYTDTEGEVESYRVVFTTPDPNGDLVVATKRIPAEKLEQTDRSERERRSRLADGVSRIATREVAVTPSHVSYEEVPPHVDDEYQNAVPAEQVRRELEEEAKHPRMIEVPREWTKQ